MSEEIPRCEDGPICDREFAPTKNGNVCIRDGHAAECHDARWVPTVTATTLKRLCFWKRDDKTKETCNKKFVNLPIVYGDRPMIERSPHKTIFAMPKSAADNFERSIKERVVSAERDASLAKLYEGIRNSAKDENLEGFTLVRISLREGDWQRLVGDLAFYRKEHPPRMDHGQVGTMWVDTVGGPVPVFETPFLPERMGGQRVIAMLHYERRPEFRRAFMPEERLRILTE
jgi:hypothetical protein